MTEFFSNLIGNDYVATVIMSLVPLIELKGGIVFAQSAGIHWALSFILAYIGSTIVFIPIYFLLKPILTLLKRIKCINGFACKIEGYFEKKANETLVQRQRNNKSTKNIEFIKTLGVFIFVAIPLPMTGVWTGTAIAVFFGLNFKNTLASILIGNFIAGALILILSVVCALIGVSLDLVLYVLFALALVLFIIFIIKISCIKTKDEMKG